MDNPRFNYVDQNYRINASTEQMLPYGSHLENGMKVLIGEPTLRADLNRIKINAEEAYNALVNNRWCIVKDLAIDSNRISFTGVYEDGTEYKRNYDSNYPWLVKKRSLREITAKKAATEPSWVSETERAWQREKGTSTRLR